MPLGIITSSELIGVIYARYSSHNQKEESIEQQIEECMAFATANKIKIIEVYPDKAISGKTDKRPQFQRMMRDAEKREFSVVIAYKSNRIARNMLHALECEERLAKYGIETLYAKEEFGNTAAGRFALRTMMNVNQFYSENMAEDIKRGMKDNASECKVNGSLPLGYVRGADGKYAIDPDEAAIVQEIYRKVLDDVPLVDIAQDLNMRGIKTKRGGSFNKSSFSKMLSNSTYIGVYSHSGVVKENGVPPIIDKEVFAAVQEKVTTKKNPRGRHRENGDYLLTGKLFCGYCKSYMVGVSGTAKDGTLHYYYQCQKRRNEKTCEKKNVRREWIEELVALYTKEFILQDDVIEWIADCAMDVLKDSGTEAEITAMEAELSENQKAAKNIMSAIEHGIITSMTKDRLLELELDISTLEKSIALAKATNSDSVIEKERIIFSLEKLKDGDIHSAEFQRDLIGTFVKSVYLWDDRIEIEYSYVKGMNRFTYKLDKNKKNGDSVRLESDRGHHRRAIRTQYGNGEIIVTSVGFVLLCPLPNGQEKAVV